MRRYPNIERVCLEIAYSDGGINRDRSREVVEGEIRAWLEKQKEEGFSTGGVFNSRQRYDFFEIDRWIGTLSDDQLSIVADGEMTEADDILVSSPIGTKQLLEYYFDEVC